MDQQPAPCLFETNYIAALELVQERYGKSQQVIIAHMDKLLNIPKILVLETR